MPSGSARSPSVALSLLPRLALAGAIVVAYLMSFSGVMVFDDLHAIVENPAIRHLGRLDLVLFPPGTTGATTDGRPVVNLTFALNYAISGPDPWSYHAVNLAIHVLAALLLYGVVRRTLENVGRGRRTPPPAAAGSAIPPYSADSTLLALTIAALWALHPLQPTAVTYLVQRAESLMGLFFLLTLYCFVRGTDSPKPARWYAGAVTACLLGMGCKEVMAAAPLLVLLYDRTFLAGSWRDAWQRRGRIHAALMGTWLLLAVLVASSDNRGGTTGFGTAITSWNYALTQCQAIVHYLRLAVWPHPLVFDYGTPLVRDFSAVAPQAVLLLGLLGLTGWALVRRPALGFLGAWFFLILAPSSSFVPVATQTMAEHRMYLPLAAVLALLTLGAHALAGRRALLGLLALAVVAGGLTGQRNILFRSELALWGDTVDHLPENPRAHTNLGIALAGAGRLPEAITQYEEAIRLQPDNAATRLNLCDALTRTGRAAEAVAQGEEALRLEPRSADAHLNVALALAQLGRTEEAVAHYEEVLRLEPGAPDVPGRLAPALSDLGNQAAARGDFAGAITRYRRALALAPDLLAARNNLANALLVSGQVDEAIAQYREVLRLNPGDNRVQENLARALEMQRANRP